MPTLLILIVDLDTKDKLENLLRYLTLSNIAHSPTLKANETLWHGSDEIFDVLYQIIIEMCSSRGQIVADLLASTGASIRTYKASGHHIFGLEEDKEIFDLLVKSLCTSHESS